MSAHPPPPNIEPTFVNVNGDSMNLFNYLDWIYNAKSCKNKYEIRLAN